MSANISEISISSLLALSMSVVAEAVMTMAPKTLVPVNAMVNPNYMELVGILHFNPAMATIVLALIVNFFTIGFAFGYLKNVYPGYYGKSRRSVGSTLQSFMNQRLEISKLGLDPEMWEALPRVQYKDLLAHELEKKYFDALCASLYSTQTKA